MMRCEMIAYFVCFGFFFKQKTAYEMRISDWSSDVCSSDLQVRLGDAVAGEVGLQPRGDFRPLGLVPDLLREQLLRAHLRAVDEALLAVLQGDVEALVRGPRGDVAPHDAGADAVHALAPVVLPPTALQPPPPEEHAGKVAPGRR